MDIPKELLDAAKQHRLVPFIGAGFSRIFNLPTHAELIDRLANALGFDPEIAQLHGDLLQLAEYLYIQNNGLAKIRSELDKRFNSHDIEIEKSEAHLLLTELGASAIYTTNWDNLIERAFDYRKMRYNKIASVDDIKEARLGIPDIIKIHGDFSANDESIVFTESSYFARLDLESPLDIRLRADIFGHTLLFIGYSFSDVNIRYMWFKLQRLLAARHTTKKREPFAYIVTAHRNPVFEEICKHSRMIETIPLDAIDPQPALVGLLKELAEAAK